MRKDKEYWYWLVRYIDGESFACGSFLRCADTEELYEKFAIKISTMTTEDFKKECKIMGC